MSGTESSCPYHTLLYLALRVAGTAERIGENVAHEITGAVLRAACLSNVERAS